jgi:hypothetical protein
MNILDFIIGALLANAMPHFIFGITNTKFLGLFGFGARGNILYAVLQFALCIVLYSLNYSLESLIANGFLLGGMAVMVLFFIFGKRLLNYFNKWKQHV